MGSRVPFCHGLQEVGAEWSLQAMDREKDDFTQVGDVLVLSSARVGVGMLVI